MSVVVFGMEMPTKCCDCDVEHFLEDAYGYDFGHECPFVYKGYTEDIRGRGRLEECPLRPLPEKHGRLVDIGEIENEYSLVATDMRGFKLEPLDMVDSSIIFQFKPWKEVETIIEAEGENDV